MKYIKRKYDNLEKFFKKGKVLIIYGPRRVGKTTLVEKYYKKFNKRKRYVTGDDIRVSTILSSRDLKLISEFLKDIDLLIIDEGQQIKEIGFALKMMIDKFPEKKIIATGSSSFDLSQKVGEPLTGRKRTLLLLPVWQGELTDYYTKYELKENLEEFLLFGSYPEVITSKTKGEKIEILTELVNSYLLKDILSFDRVKSSKKLYDLLKLLAHQIGSEVSKNELSNAIGVDSKTVERYLDLLEKTFIIKKVGPYYSNKRKTIRKKSKYYFLDLGVRNGVISDFNILENRNDIGALFENFVFIERYKKNIYSRFYGNIYFWKSYSGREIDLVEEIDGKLKGFEIKYSIRKKLKQPNDWKNLPNSTFTQISLNNYLDFVL